MNASLILGRVALVALALAGPASAATVNAQVEQAARELVARQLESSALSEPQVQIDVVTTRAPQPCAQPLAIEPVDTRMLSRMRFAVRCPVDGGWRSEYVVRAHVSAVVAVAASSVPVGEPLTDTMVSLERRDITLIPDALGSTEAAVGQTSRRSLRPGDVLRAGQLAAPVLVKRGDQILMVARREQVEVSTSGEALDNGARGAIIRVRNAASGQVVRMRVTGAGIVEPVDTGRISR